MAFKRQESGDRDVSHDTQIGVSTEPGESVMDKRQDTNREHAEVDASVLDEQAPELTREPQEVKDKEVLYMPRKDFSARINQSEFHFRAGVQTRVSRDVANMLLEDEERGYVKD